MRLSEHDLTQEEEVMFSQPYVVTDSTEEEKDRLSPEKEAPV